MSGRGTGQAPRSTRRLVHCTLPPELVHQPVLHGLVQSTEAVVNVRRANVDVESGVAWYILELTGPAEELDRAEAWLVGNGVAVEPIDPGGPAAPPG